MGGGFEPQQQATSPEIHIHTEQPTVVKEKSFPTEAVWAVAVTVIAATILTWVNRSKK